MTAFKIYANIFGREMIVKFLRGNKTKILGDTTYSVVFRWYVKGNVSCDFYKSRREDNKEV